MRTLREITPAQFHQRESGLPPEIARRCRFIVEENDRVLQLAAALPAGDHDAIQMITAASFRGAGPIVFPAGVKASLTLEPVTTPAGQMTGRPPAESRRLESESGWGETCDRS